MGANNIYQYTADESCPPAVLGRFGLMEDFHQVLLDDLIESHAWLDRELKESFFALWVKEEDFDNSDLDDPIVELDDNNVVAFAATEPVVDLHALREWRVV